MNRKSKIPSIAVITLGLAIAPYVGFAETADVYGSAALGTEVVKIQEFIFGIPMKAASVMGAAYGLGRTYMTGNIMPAVTFGGAGFVGLLVPKFINGLHPVATILISQILG